MGTDGEEGRVEGRARRTEFLARSDKRGPCTASARTHRKLGKGNTTTQNWKASIPKRALFL